MAVSQTNIMAIEVPGCLHIPVITFGGLRRYTGRGAFPIPRGSNYRWRIFSALKINVLIAKIEK